MINDRLGPLYELTLSTGLRQGEVLSLALDSVDFERATMNVARQLYREKGHYVSVEPKT